MPVMLELEKLGWVNNRWQARKGGELGGKPFTRNNLYKLLTNVAYAGKVKYKDEVHDDQLRGRDRRDRPGRDPRPAAKALDVVAPVVSIVAKFLLRSYPMHVGFGRLTGVSAELPEVQRHDQAQQYVKIAEAARILGVSQSTLRAWAEAGKIPVRRNPANRYRLFLRRDLERFLAKVAGRTKDLPS